MIEYVLDASALIALLREEPGADKVKEVVSESCISAVNLAETLGKMVHYGKDLEATAYHIERLCIPVIPFDAEHAKLVASLWPRTHPAGLALGDRACLATAIHRSIPALTADAGWGICCPEVEIVKIRESKIR